MRVAVTGASGMLGRFVVEEIARDHEIVALDLVPHPSRPSIVVDVLDANALIQGLEGCDAVIHLAAIDQARTASEHQFFETNVLGSWNVLLAAERLGLHRAVLCSSVAALGLRPAAPPVSLPIPVDHPLRPITAYGISKQMAEVVAAGFVRRGKLHVVCLRLALVTFPHQVAEWATVAAEADGAPVPAEILLVADRVLEPLPLTYAYVGPDDAARAFTASLQADVDGFATFYVTAEDTMSSKPTVEIMADRLGARPPITRAALFNGLSQASPFDLEPTLRTLKWSSRERWAGLVGRYGRFVEREDGVGAPG